MTLILRTPKERPLFLGTPIGFLDFRMLPNLENACEAMFGPLDAESWAPLQDRRGLVAAGVSKSSRSWSHIFNIEYIYIYMYIHNIIDMYVCMYVCKYSSEPYWSLFRQIQYCRQSVMNVSPKSYHAE